MKVLKFGGTSVGTSASLANVKKIVESIDEPCITVVSALGGLTDRLISTAKLAAASDPAYHNEMEAIRIRHYNIINDVVDQDKRKATLTAVDTLLNELHRNYDGLSLIHDLPGKTLDTIVSFGERMSSIIVAAMLEDASHHQSLDFIKTEKWYNKNIADTDLTSELIRKEFPSPKREITGGFISTDRDTGEITNLGRGGSDFTAALIAAALGADVLEIWTDVDGFMTADPRIISHASVIPHMSFIESMELCSFGAKVIYPPTIYPVFHKNIPIRILNTFNPEAPGTIITDRIPQHSQDSGATGISAIRNTSLMTLRGALTANVAAINTRAFNAMARNGISVFMVSQPDTDSCFSFALANSDAEMARKALLDEFAPELSDGQLDSIEETDDLSTLAIVGENIRDAIGLPARIRHTLHREGVRVAASAAGTSATTISFVVPRTDTDRSMRLLHSLLFGNMENTTK